MPDAWSPSQYERFRAERAQPFWDLAALVEPRPGMRIADLGCGTGELTAELHQKLQARETLGVDSSAAMLSRAPQAPGLRFGPQDIAVFEPREKLDLIFSNAALHWVADHPALLQRLTAALAPGGQLAVQMPMADELVTPPDRVRAGAVCGVQAAAGRIRAALAAAGADALRGLAAPPGIRAAARPRRGVHAPARVSRRGGRVGAGRALDRLPEAAVAAGLGALPHPARPVHGTAAGRSATLREGRKEASSWQNASYRPYGHVDPAFVERRANGLGRQIDAGDLVAHRLPHGAPEPEPQVRSTTRRPGRRS